MDCFNGNLLSSNCKLVQLEPTRAVPAPPSIVESRDVARVLVHGGIACKPWFDLSDSKLHPEIKKALTKLGVDALHPLQRHAWPSIKKRQNVVFVGRKTQGKRLAYIAPVMDFVLDADKPEGHGPLAIIICPGYNQAQAAYHLCKKMLSSCDRKDVRVLMFYNSTLSVSDTVKCLNGCEVLVTTPRCLVKLLQFSTNLCRIGVFVLDHADLLFAKFLTEVKGLLREVKEITKRRLEDGEVVQVVAACEKWIPRVESFCLKIPANPTVIISCPLEAALYAKPQLELYIVKGRSKTPTLLEILKDVAGPQRVVIFCSSPEEVESLSESLKNATHYVLHTSDNSTEQQVETVKRNWDESGSPHFPVLVCTDAEFLELNIRDATCLIHYSMRPSGTKSQFGARFSCLMENYPNIFKDRIACPTVHVILDETNDNQIAGIVHFSQRLGKNDEDLIKIAKDSVIRKEQEKKLNPLCLDLQMFGDCWDSRSCEDRHILLPEVDAPPPDFPRSGWVKVKILHTISACHFSGRIIEHCSHPDGDFKKWKSDYVSIAMQMSRRFSSDQDNRAEHGNPKVGDICAVFEKTVSLYHRAVVLKVIKEDRKPTICELRLLDEGVNIMRKAFELYHLSDELQAFPPQAVDIFVCRLKPKDLDDAWSTSVIEKVENWVRDANNAARDTYFKGKVVLSLRSKIWVDPLELYRKLKNVHTHIITRSIRTDLLNKNLAVDNPSHVDKLYALCKQNGFPDAIPEKPSAVAKSKAEKKQAVPQWAHLDLDVLELTEFSYAENPRLFFIRRRYTTESFSSLKEKTQAVGENTAGSETVFQRGRVCLALCSTDNRWARAVMNSTVKDGRVPVFFVDFGDTEEVAVESIAVIPDQLITQLPFQAIECSLAGIKARGAGWSDDAVDFLYDMCEGKTLFAKPVHSSSGELTSGKHYLIILLDTTGEKDVVINDLLINENLAEAAEGERKFLENSLSGPIADVNKALYSGNGSDDETDFERPAGEGVKVPTEESVATPDGNIINCNGYDFNFDEVDSEDAFEMCTQMLDIKLPEPGQAKGSRQNGPAIPPLPAPDSQPSAGQNIAEEDRSNAVANQGKRIPALMSARAPQMSWYQDVFTLHIKISPGAVTENYYLSWTSNRIQFSACDADGGKCFHADLVLCGTILPEELAHSLHGLDIDISVRKALAGWMWPRLLRAQIQPKWLKHDASYEVQSSDSECESTLEKYMERAHRSGTKLKKRQKPLLVKPVLDAALSSEGNESNPEYAENMDDQIFGMVHGKND